MEIDQVSVLNIIRIDLENFEKNLSDINIESSINSENDLQDDE